MSTRQTKRTFPEHRTGAAGSGLGRAGARETPYGLTGCSSAGPNATRSPTRSPRALAPPSTDASQTHQARLANSAPLRRKGRRLAALLPFTRKRVVLTFVIAAPGNNRALPRAGSLPPAGYFQLKKALHRPCTIFGPHVRRFCTPRPMPILRTAPGRYYIEENASRLTPIAPVTGPIVARTRSAGHPSDAPQTRSSPADARRPINPRPGKAVRLL